jgi:hypothetical protein
MLSNPYHAHLGKQEGLRSGNFANRLVCLPV